MRVRLRALASSARAHRGRLRAVGLVDRGRARHRLAVAGLTLLPLAAVSLALLALARRAFWASRSHAAPPTGGVPPRGSTLARPPQSPLSPTPHGNRPRGGWPPELATQRLLPGSNRAGSCSRAVVALLVAGGALGVYLYEKHRTGNIYHPHAAFVPAAGRPRCPRKARERFAWPLYGYTKNHTRFFAASPRLRPPFRTCGHRRRPAGVPARALRRALFQLGDDAVLHAIDKYTGKDCGAASSARCRPPRRPSARHGVRDRARALAELAATGGSWR